MTQEARQRNRVVFERPLHRHGVFEEAFRFGQPTELPFRRRLVRLLLTSVVFPHILAGQLRRIKEELEVTVA